MPEKQCTDCGEWYDEEAFFRHRVVTNASVTRRPICIGCEQKARQEPKDEDRILIKARDAIIRHADKFVKKGLAISRIDFQERYGWNVEKLAHDFEHAYANGCHYCRRLFKSMANGLSDLTIDIVRPDDPPYYTINKAFCCQTCNREKGLTPAHLWARKLQCWEKWERRQKILNAEPLAALPLFEHAMKCERGIQKWAVVA